MPPTNSIKIMKEAQSDDPNLKPGFILSSDITELLWKEEALIHASFPMLVPKSRTNKSASYFT